MTLQAAGKFTIVLNPCHALTRQRSDLMHELAHVELRHSPARVEVSQSGLLLLSDYSDEQEREADWFGAGLLLPREKNWIPTVPGKNWFSYFRFYQPNEAYFDRSWPLPDFEQVH
jgi:hypothetical protein